MLATAEVQVTWVTPDGQEVVSALDDVDARAVVEGLPVRDFPVYAGRRNYSGYFWSATTGSHVVYESLLELAWLWLADFDSRVLGIAAQPMRWRGLDADRVRSRVPDFLCVMSDGSVRVVDVKPQVMVARAEVQSSLNWTREACRSRGWEYEVWTHPDPVVLRNVRWIAAARLPHVLTTLDVVRTVEATGGGSTFAALEDRLRRAGRATPRLEILGALWSGGIVCDLGSSLDRDTWLEPHDV